MNSNCHLRKIYWKMALHSLLCETFPSLFYASLRTLFHSKKPLPWRQRACKCILRVSTIGSTKTKKYTAKLMCLSTALLWIVKSKITCPSHSHSSGFLSTNAISQEVGSGWEVRSDRKWLVTLQRCGMPLLTTKSTISLVNSSVNVPVICTMRKNEENMNHISGRVVCDGEKNQRAKFYLWWYFLTLVNLQTPSLSPLPSIHASTWVPVDVNSTSKNKTKAAFYDESEVLRSTFLMALPISRMICTAKSTCLDVDCLKVNFVPVPAQSPVN